MVYGISYNNQYSPTSDVDCKIILKNKLVVEDMLVEDMLVEDIQVVEQNQVVHFLVEDNLVDSQVDIQVDIQVEVVVYNQ